ncbi:hypothetical protein HAX54_046540 [Datura stramonium]|uniref:Uncharacterized protein n=1 Tax=Datura stramonium TaxID=4076 RepID=A0ABS8WJ42_DATST|nr:hypothetical protein [Datura stramonium]
MGTGGVSGDVCLWNYVGGKNSGARSELSQETAYPRGGEISTSTRQAKIHALESDEVQAFSDVPLNLLRAVKVTDATGTKLEMMLIMLLLDKSLVLVWMVIELWLKFHETRLELLTELKENSMKLHKCSLDYSPI